MFQVVLSLTLLFSSVLSRDYSHIPRYFKKSHFLEVSVGSTTCNVLDYGAKGDGKTDDTKAVQSAIDTCRADSSGGTIYFPKGYSFLLFPVTVSSSKGSLSIYIESGSTILVNDDINAWPSNENFFTLHSTNGLVMSGGGTIDGQGQAWWDCFNANSDCYRPDVIYSSASVSNMLISDLTIKNAPKFHCSLSSFHTEVTGVTISAPSDSPNTDGVDPNNNEFYIHDNHISNGDDNIAIKNGNDSLIENNYFGTGHGASIGSLDGDCWMKNITFRNNVFDGTTNGARIKAKPGSKQGRVWDITYENLSMTNVKNSIIITQYYESTSTKSSYLYFDHLTISNLTSYYSTNPGQFECQPSTPCTDFTLKDIYISASNSKLDAYEFVCENAHGTCSGVTPSCCLES